MVGLDASVEAITTEQMPTPAMRPPYSALDNNKLGKFLGRPMRHWESALGDYLVAKGHIAAAPPIPLS